MTALTARHDRHGVGAGEDVLTEQLLRSVSIFRWATLIWAIIGVVLSRDELTRPWLAIALLAIATMFTATTGLLATTNASILSSYWFLFLELGIGVTLLLGDGMVYQQTRAQSLPWAWPAAGVIAVGVCLGQRAGILSALLVGGTSLFVESTVLDRSVLVSAFSKIGLWLLVGSIAGALTQRLRLAEREISVARTREEVARELHDGVLQTLAVIQRRSDDPALSNMAKDQENSLRLYLADSRAVAMTASEPAGLETTLRETAAGSERLYDLTVQVIVTPDCPDRPDLPAPLIHALAGAVKESIANASKHGDASKVTVFAEPSERDQDRYGLFVSIKDDGAGFIIDEVVEGIGLARSIRGRITEQGGTVELKSRPGRGTEVQLWV